MFDLKGLAGMAGLMKDLPRLKARMEEMKRRLADLSCEAETGGGAVRVTVNGQLQVVSLQVDQVLLAGLVDPGNADDRAMAEDLVAGAVNSAIEKARQMAEQEFASVARELGLPLPPGVLGGLLTP